MRKQTLLITAVFILLMASGCGSSLTTRGPSTEITVGDILLQDDFSSNRGWEFRTADWAYMNIVNESYRMWLTRNVYIYGLCPVLFFINLFLYSV